MPLHKLNQVRWQNHNLHWILHPKKHLKIFGGVLFAEGRPPKIPTFRRFDPEGLERRPQYSVRRRNFKKILRSIVVLQWRDNQHVLPRLTSRSAVPHPNNKKVPFSPVLAPFLTKWLGHHRYQRETWWNQLILQSHCRTEILRKYFFNFCLRSEI